MILKWVRSMLGLGERETVDDGLEAKTRGLQNMKRLNELVLSQECQPDQLIQLELGAETISLNLRKGDTDKAKKNGGAV